MRPTIVLLVVGLTPRHLGPHTPRLSPLARAGVMRPLSTVTPAVTCTVQATFITGALPRDHGIVANGWLFRDLMEVWLWRQSNRLVAGEKIWDAGKRARSRLHRRQPVLVVQHGRERTTSASRRARSTRRTGASCPTATRSRRSCATSSRASSARFPCSSSGDRRRRSPRRAGSPTPRCTFAHARADPDAGLPAAPRLRPAAVRAGRSAHRDEPRRDRCRRRRADRRPSERDGARVIVLSEYGITPVSRPIHINRALREAGLLARARRGRRRAARPSAIARLRGGRPSGRAHLRRATRPGRRRCGAS